MVLPQNPAATTQRSGVLTSARADDEHLLREGAICGAANETSSSPSRPGCDAVQTLFVIAFIRALDENGLRR